MKTTLGSKSRYDTIPLETAVELTATNQRRSERTTAEKRSGYLILVAFAVAADALTHSMSAQSWQTVDDFIFSSNGYGSAQSVSVDASGGIYVVGGGSSGAGSPQHGLVRYSSDQDATWKTVDDFLNPTNTSLDLFESAIHADHKGNIFVAGRYRDGVGAHWTVRRSSDGGNSWATVDDFALSAFLSQTPNGMASDTNGTVFVVGGGVVSASAGSLWLIRSSSDGGVTWQTATDPGLSGTAYSVACVGKDVYVAGSTRAAFSLEWAVIKSSDGGLSWTVVDSLSYSTVPHAIAVDRTGNLYVVGSAATSTNTLWVARKGLPGGTDWSTCDEFGFGIDSITSAWGVAADPAGNLYVSGGVNSGNGQRWVARVFSVSTGQWTTTDDFAYSPSKSSIVNAIASDAVGNIFSVGYGTPPSAGQIHWLVRKLAAVTPTPPALALSLAGGMFSLSWPTSASGFTLEVADTFGATSVWSPCPVIPVVDGAQNVVTIGATNAATFFRLRK